MKSWLDLNLSELVDQSLKLGVLPIFKFVDKDTIEVGEVESKSLSPMEETPLTVLEKQIRLYERFIKKIETKEGIAVPDSATEEKLVKFIGELREKIKIFESAITLLNNHFNNNNG